MQRYNIVHFVKISKFVYDLQCTFLIAELQATSYRNWLSCYET